MQWIGRTINPVAKNTDPTRIIVLSDYEYQALQAAALRLDPSAGPYCKPDQLSIVFEFLHAFGHGESMKVETKLVLPGQ